MASKNKEAENQWAKSHGSTGFIFSARTAHLCFVLLFLLDPYFSDVFFVKKSVSVFTSQVFTLIPEYQLNLVWEANHPSCLSKAWSRGEPLCVIRASQTLFQLLAVQSTELWKVLFYSLVICLGNFYLEHGPSHWTLLKVPQLIIIEGWHGIFRYTF